MGASRVERGATLQGEYVLRELLGERNGLVWTAQRKRDGAVVVARMFAGLPSEVRAKVIDLATRARRVRHPGLAAISSCGTDGDAVFMIEEHVEGPSLAEHCERGGIPPIARAAELVLQLCRALECAHRQGVMHDALCPSHVLLPGSLTDTGQPLRAKLIALGVPASARAWPPVLSTALYMAPEQLAPLRLGLPPGPTSAATNVYSLGALLYDLCSGGPPFPASSIDELAEAHATARVMPPSRINPQVPVTLDTVLLRALSTDPEQRYASVSELIEALSTLRLSTGSSGVQPVGVFFSPDSVHASARPEPRATWHGGFDERPTTKSELPPLPPAPRLPRLPEGVSSSRPPAGQPSAARRSSVPPGRSSAPPGRTPRSSDPTRRTLTPVPAPIPKPAAERRSTPPAILPLAPRPSFHALQRARKHKATIALAASCLACLAVIAYGLAGPSPEDHVRSIPLAPASAADPQAPPSRPRAFSPPAPPPLAQIPQSTAAGSDARPQPADERPQRSERGPNVSHRASRGAERSRGAANAPVQTRAVPPEPEAGTQPTDQREEGTAVDPLAVLDEEHDPASNESVSGPVEAASAPRDQPSSPSAFDASRVAPLPAGSRPAPLPAPLPASTKPVVLKARPTHAKITGLTVRGSLPSSLVEQAIARVVPQLNECVRKASAAGGTAPSAMRVAFELDEQGRARAARVRGASSATLQACVTDAAGRIASRRAPDTGTVAASFAVEPVP